MAVPNPQRKLYICTANNIPKIPIAPPVFSKSLYEYIGSHQSDRTSILKVSFQAHIHNGSMRLRLWRCEVPSTEQRCAIQFLILLKRQLLK